MLRARSDDEHEATRRLKTELLVAFDGVASVAPLSSQAPANPQCSERKKERKRERKKERKREREKERKREKWRERERENEKSKE